MLEQARQSQPPERSRVPAHRSEPERHGARSAKVTAKCDAAGLSLKSAAVRSGSPEQSVPSPPRSIGAAAPSRQSQAARKHCPYACPYVLYSTIQGIPRKAALTGRIRRLWPTWFARGGNPASARERQHLGEPIQMSIPGNWAASTAPAIASTATGAAGALTAASARNACLSPSTIPRCSATPRCSPTKDTIRPAP